MPRDDNPLLLAGVSKETDGNQIVFRTSAQPGLHIRKAGLNFREGAEVVNMGQR